MTMNLLDVVRRQPVPEPWAEGEKIPWNDPDFSRRMLREHLSQEHNAASRRFEIIDQHVNWIHRAVLSRHSARVLDLGCGPGLYTSRLCKLGHECVGSDFSPASIAYARDQAQRETLRCRYVEGDIRAVPYGTGYGLVMLIHGELNTFRLTEARAILEKAHRALAAGGLLLLEPHTFSAIHEIGERSPSWHSADRGLFSARPHVCLVESFWDAGREAATERYFIIDALTGDVTRHASSMQAYTNDQYQVLLDECGFSEVGFHPSLRGVADESQLGLMAVVSQK
jgi:SAM-dependent methyltransferase